MRVYFARARTTAPNGFNLLASIPASLFPVCLISDEFNSNLFIFKKIV